MKNFFDSENQKQYIWYNLGLLIQWIFSLWIYTTKFASSQFLTQNPNKTQILHNQKLSLMEIPY